MKTNLKWYAIDKKYVEYLRKAESRVQYINYDKQFKPYIGIILQILNFNYYVPISSVGNKPYKIEKYSKMKDDIDLFKVYDKNRNLVAVLNINNMIPINEKYVKEIKYNEIDNYRSFRSDEEKKKYIYLLQTELSYLRKNSEIITNNAEKLYDIKKNKPLSKVAMRTCDFEILEQKCNEYHN